MAVARTETLAGTSSASVELAATAGAASDADQAGTQASRSAGEQQGAHGAEEQETAERQSG